jgi:hypothetical protein
MSFHTKVVAKSFNLAPSNTRLKLEVGVNTIPVAFSAAILVSTSSEHDNVRADENNY